MSALLRGLSVLCVLFLVPCDGLAGGRDAGSTGIELGLGVSLLSDMGFSHSSHRQDPSQDYEDYFFPNRPGMDYEKKSWGFSWEFGLGAEPSATIGKWEVGLPIFYQISFINTGNKNWFQLNKTVAAVILDWWNDVELFETRLKKTSPAFGISIRRDWLRLQYATQRFQISQHDFEGKDCYGCRNVSWPRTHDVIERGWGHRVDLMFVGRWGRGGDEHPGVSRRYGAAAGRDDVKPAHLRWQGGAGIYCEANGSKLIICGLSARLGPVFLL
jgi:hypothetical protein